MSKHCNEVDLSPESNKLTQFKKIDKIKIAVIAIIVILASYVGWDVYGKIKINLQSKYFNAGVIGLMKELVVKSENCQKIKLVTGEEFVRTSCLSEAKQDEVRTSPDLFVESIINAPVEEIIE